MRKELIRQSVRRAAGMALLLVLVGGLLLAFSGKSLWQLVRGPRQLFVVTEEAGSPEGEYVTAELPYIYGLFAEETTEENGTVRSTHQMYVVDANQMQYMALQLDPDRYAEADALYEQTWAYMESGSEADRPVPMQVTGRLTKMEDADLVAYYEDMFGGDVSDDAVSYWILEDGLLEAGQPGMVVFLAVAGAVLVLWGAVLVIRAASGATLRELDRFCTENGGLQKEELESQWQQGLAQKGLWINRLAVLFFQNSRLRILPAGRLVWAYQQITTHRYAGFIPMGKSYALVLRDDKGKKYIVAQRRQANTLEALDYIQQTLPGAVVGYDASMEPLYAADPAGFAAKLRAGASQPAE